MARATASSAPATWPPTSVTRWNTCPAMPRYRQLPFRNSPTQPPCPRRRSATSNGRIVRRMPNVVKFREDPDAMLVLSLEDYDEATGRAAKAAIMQKDVVGSNPPITSVRSAEEGLLVSLDRRGAVDLPLIA